MVQSFFDRLPTGGYSENLIASIPVHLAEKHKIVPIKLEGNILTIAMANVNDVFALDAARFSSGFEVVARPAPATDITKAIKELYGLNRLVEKAVNKSGLPEIAGLNGRDGGPNSPVADIVDSLIRKAVEQRASDIHLEPEAAGLRVRFRIDGLLRYVISFPGDIQPEIISRIKIMSDMNITERRLPQDGRLSVMVAGHSVDIRTASLPTIGGEKLVMRILDRRAILRNVKALGFSKQNLAKYHLLYNRPAGMILVTGPTGSGKTTTLYATLAELNNGDRNLVTIEDPVEYRIKGVNQVPVNSRVGLNFANGLRSLLRQDPDIIMVGEIRDSETATIAVRAALTGRLVFSTIHTGDAAGALTRLIDMGVEPFLIASAVTGIVGQRLVRTICPQCRYQYYLTASDREYGLLNLEPGLDITLYRGEGCSFCHGTGYVGRLAVQEVMEISPAVHAAIKQKVTTKDLANIARREGMRTMLEDGIDKALQGLTTVDEIIKLAFDEQPREPVHD